MKVIHHCLVLSFLCVVGAGCSDLTWKSPDDLCGNGELDFGEQCDEGMNNGADKWCTSKCVVNTGVHCNGDHTECKPVGCGNGMIDDGEECDDGEGNNGDDKWCDPNCKINTRVRCSSEHTDCKPIGCGNGMIDDGEECDDGNSNNGNDKWCDQDCKVNTKVHCNSERTDCKPIGCGDGVIASDEECDNGTDNSDEAWCTTQCKINSAFLCDENQNCVRIECGNGKVEGNEECDDGDLDAGDGCNSDCRVETENGYICPKLGGECIQIECGDGKLNADLEANDPEKADHNNYLGAVEVCDAGSVNNEDNWCTKSCQLNPEYMCDAELKNCVRIVCGNNVVEGSEECDDGDLDAGDGCNSDCRVETENGYICPKSGGECIQIECGDGKLNADLEANDPEKADHNNYVGAIEVCDAGAANDEDNWCTKSCTLNPEFLCDADQKNCVQKGCGNGIVETDSDEVCDDSNKDDGDGCSSVCNVESGSKDNEGYICPKLGGKCIPVECGNGSIEGNPNEFVGAVEECDEGKENNGDDNWCRANCTINTDVYCDETHKNCTKILCGDGKREGWEECDDGNNNSDESWCMLNCMINPKFRKDDDNWVMKKCGDGFLDLDIVELDELCDDGNNNTGDGCDEKCHPESGYACPKGGGKCIHSVCGNGTLEGKADDYVGATEECDDGWKNSNTNWCMMDCTINPSFRIDENGNSVKRYCGDGFIDTFLGEACDDGNNIAGDGCDPLCNVEQFFECSESDNHISECKPICGDGVWLSDKILGTGKGEACDDGNIEDKDGCSSECEVEEGYRCSPKSFNNFEEFKQYVSFDENNARNMYKIVENSISVMAIQRDFRQYGSKEENAPGTAPQTFIDDLEEDCKDNGERGFVKDYGHPDFRRLKSGKQADIFKEYLNSDDKPVLNENESREERKWTCKASADMWFNDDLYFNRRFVDALVFRVYDGGYWFNQKYVDYSNVIAIVDDGERCDNESYYSSMLKSDYYGLNNQSGVYYYQVYNLNGRDSGYYPIIGKSLEHNVCSAGEIVKNSEFTTEIHTYVRYKQFNKRYYVDSDDDSWMFVNHRLLLDNGGIHSSEEEEALMGAKDISVGKNKMVKYNEEYKMFENGIYPVSVFFIERGSGATLILGIPDLIDAQASICVKKAP